MNQIRVGEGDGHKSNKLDFAVCFTFSTLSWADGHIFLN